MDIEERAEKWARDYNASQYSCARCAPKEVDLMAAYLAGSTQTQVDYMEYAHSQGQCVCDGP